MKKKTGIDDLASRDLRQEAWEREMFSKPLRAWTASDRFRYWTQPKRLKAQLAIAAIILVAIGASVLRDGD